MPDGPRTQATIARPERRVSASASARARSFGSRPTDEERRAVEVAPLEVVDRDDEAPPRRHAPQQRAQAREGAPPELGRVGRLLSRARARSSARARGCRGRHRDGLHAAEHGEQPQQRHELARRGQQPLDLARLEPPQVPRERVDHAVDGLVRHGLALVAAAGEADRLAPPGEPGKEPLDERALPHARRPVDVHGDRAPEPRDGAERAGEGGELAQAADERGPLVARDGSGSPDPGRRDRLLDRDPGRRAGIHAAHAAHAARPRADALEDLIVVGPVVGVAGEEVEAEVLEVLGDRIALRRERYGEHLAGR